MKHDLEYFDAFLNNPASLSIPEFNRKISEWIDFIRENPKKYGMKGRGWKAAWHRIGDDIERRDRIKEELDELSFLLDMITKFDDDERLKIHRRWVDFVKKYQLEFEFTDEMIARGEAKLAACVEAVKKERLAEINVQIATGKAEASKNKLADAMFEAQDKYGKPFSFPAYKTPKRGQGN